MRSFILGLALAVVASCAATQPANASNNDEAIAKGIANQLRDSGLLKDYRVGVKYQDGVAWLSGSVTSQKQREVAELLVRNCTGVEHVISKLEVEPPKGIQTASTRTSSARRPSGGGNMPVPYARAGRGIQPVSYCPGGNCMPGGTMGPAAVGGGGYSPAAGG